MKKLFIAFFAALAALGASAQGNDYDANFDGRTLRLDYVLGGDSARQFVVLDRMAKLPGWAGRTSRLKELPREGNGTVTVLDAATGDTLYCTSFSSLFHEWLRTDEAATTPRAFHITQLVPFPRREAIIDVTLRDARRQPMTSMRHKVDPADVLIEQKGVRNVTPHKYIRRSANPRAIDVAIVGEGYTPAEMDSFYRHAEIAVEALESHEPFKSHAADFNYVAVAMPSAESGVSVPRFNDWKNTAFGSHFSTFYSDRYLTSENLNQIHDALAGIPYEHIIILANTDEYGGGGIYNSYTLTAARHKLFRSVVVHEFGHSFGGLADEYFYEKEVMSDTYPLDVEPWEPNITTLRNFDSKWAKLLPAGTPVPTPIELKHEHPFGVFEGGGYSFKGIYRPADECRMRNNTYPTFCPACIAALDELINFYVK